MQTDIWLTEEISYPERCPLCSASLKKGSTTCFSCGFSTHPTGSSVWIDPAIYGYSLSSSQRHPPQRVQQRGMRDPRSYSQPGRQTNPVTPNNSTESLLINYAEGDHRVVYLICLYKGWSPNLIRI